MTRYLMKIHPYAATSMGIFSRKWLFLLLVVLLSLLSQNQQQVLAKITSGDFRLSGLNTEYVLGSFAVSAKSSGNMKVTFTSDKPYQLNKDVKLHLYRDDKWDAFQTAPDCTGKVPHAMKSQHVSLERNPTKKEEYLKIMNQELDNTNDNRIHYYYFVITDCSLEFYMHDDQVPTIRYELDVRDQNDRHVGADETHLKSLHTITMLISGILAIGLALTIFMALTEKSTIHAAMFLVMAAAGCDSSSSFFEIVHMQLYSKNGIGSYVSDCISAHLEAIADSFIVVLLLSVSSGWTLPSDVISVHHNANAIQKLLGGFQSPFAALKSGSPSAILALLILIFHVVLAQWGRTYNDDFDSYHDLAHLPGQILMCFRLFVGLCNLICCFQTISRCPVSLHGFYLKLAALGSFWFFSLPILVIIVNTCVVFHNRHWAVGMWGGILQTTAIVMLTWLVTSTSQSTAYHRLSHLSSKKDDLTDSLTSAGTSSSNPNNSSEEPRTWKMGKAKVRLD